MTSNIGIRQNFNLLGGKIPLRRPSEEKGRENEVGP